MSRRLNEILAGIEYRKVEIPDSVIINSICFDSRSVSDGDLFVAVRGTVTDGHKYIDNAVASGAVAVICEEIPEKTKYGVFWIEVDDSAYALSLCASAYYNNPSEKLKLIGITGTNGKTTTATMLYNIFMELGYKAGLLSTVANYIAGKKQESILTTPDPVRLNELLNEMLEAGCDYACMEVSSHAIIQQRVAGLDFDIGVFTNITHDHLDYHETFDNYLKAKKIFFDKLGKHSIALVNADDRNGKLMLQNCIARKYTYSLKSVADFKCQIIEHRFDGLNLRFGNEELYTKFVGEFNAYNMLAAVSAAELMNHEKIEVLKAASMLEPVPGRFEVIKAGLGPVAIVDYAHTPDALENVLTTINKIRRQGMKLITVVGAGGDRDTSKRPLMAKISSFNSDRVILTSDNPRFEEPESIIDDMMKGISPEYASNVIRITDRRDAIKTASLLAGKDDIILVAGKGHETYQEIKGEKHHFDDREELRKVLMSAN